ncbi:methyltransferase [Sphaerisporangium sp. B11E5]|uniref:methyltransferase n=1 Tax=Sphaerisporangium sp. B11E5 TaxID=3153563 RepID=UPI00325DC4A4
MGGNGNGAGLWAMAHLGTPMALRVAATLRIADHIAGGTRTAVAMAPLVKADPDALERLLRYLAARGVFSRGPGGTYELTPKGELLRDDHPDGMRAEIDIEGWTGRAELSFVHLLHSIRTGEAAYPLTFGRSFWEDMTAEPGLAAAFDASMAADMPVRAPAIAGALDWGRLGHVVDVGGGDGSLVIELLTKHPELRGTVVDQPETAEAARKALAAAGLADRGDAVPGSFFDTLPAGAGGYVLSLILHNWNDHAAGAILRRCAEAAGTDGSVFVVENVGPDGESPHTGMDLRMLAYYGGKERGVSDLAGLGASCGLSVTAVHPAGVLSVVEMSAR